MGSLDDDAAAAMRQRIDAVQSALKLLERPALRDQWHETLRKVGDAQVHGLVVGRIWRVLLDAGVAAADETASRLSFALSPGTDPQHASAWLEGFLADSGLVLVHDPQMLGVIDRRPRKKTNIIPILMLIPIPILILIPMLILKPKPRS